jgi:hypothetical protein
MTLGRIDAMRQGRDADEVVLQRYNSFRSKRPGKMIFVVEGSDDVVFYEVMTEKCGLSCCHESFVCRGKDRVLALRRQLDRNLSEDAAQVTYFIDRDFDGLKGEAPSQNLYCTEVYSIENYLADAGVLRRILIGELRCSEEENEDNIDIAMAFYHKLLDQFFESMRYANLIIFYLRSRGIRAGCVKDDLKKYVNVTIHGVAVTATLADVIRHVGATGHLEEDGVRNMDYDVVHEFDALSPTERWRGKFNVAFLQKILKILVEDRNADEQAIFVSRKSVAAQFHGNITRQLASAALLPASLKSFLLERLAV